MPLTSVKNPADLANVALVRIGWKGGDIGSLYEGSAAATVILDVYGQVRDALLRSAAWDFAQRSAALVLLKSAPVGGYIPGISPWNPATCPPVPWRFEYRYPLDCIKVRAVKPTPLFLPNFDPSTNAFSIASDATLQPAQEVILCNVEAALGVYTARVTDPTQWPADFTDAFADALAEAIGPTLASLQTAQAMAQAGASETAEAKMEQG